MFDALSVLFPTVDQYETALSTKLQATAARRAKREELDQIRNRRSQEIRTLLERLGVAHRFTPDPRTAQLYVANGSKKNLKLIEEAAKQAKVAYTRELRISKFLAVPEEQISTDVRKCRLQRK